MSDPARVVVFSRSPTRIARFRSALELARARGWGRQVLSVPNRLSAFIVEASSFNCDIVGVDTSAFSPPSRTVGVVGQVRRVAPTKPILLLTGAGDLSPRDWLKVAETGIAELVLDEEYTSAAALASLIRSVSGVSLGLEVIQSLDGQVPTRWVRVLERALPHSRRATPDDAGLSAALLADIWNRGATPAQLAWHLKRDGEWTPGWLVRWLICLKALSLKTVRPSWVTVATDLGFARRDDLRAFVQRLSGRREDQLTEEWLRDAFVGKRHDRKAADGERLG